MALPRFKQGFGQVNWQFSPKQLLAMYWWNLPQYQGCNGILAHGAIRSGKTIAMIFGWVQWSMKNFNGQMFGMAGKTIKTFKINVLKPMETICHYLGIKYAYNRTDSIVTLRDNAGRTNYYVVYGAKDEGSQDVVQGATFAGFFFDEVVLMPQSFVDQAIGRLSVTGAKYWMNCNPAGPANYVKEGIVDQYVRKKVLIMHFLMDDNLSLSLERREFYAAQYTGIFYRRNILGEWCLAEGLVYSAFDGEKMIFHNEVDYDQYDRLIVGYDYGIQNPTAFVMLGYNADEECIDVVKSWSYSGRDTQAQKTDNELYDDLEAFIGDAPVSYVYGDPSATSFHIQIQKAGVYSDRKADNDVVPGISFVSQLFNVGQLRIHESCTDLIKELGMYAWDEEKSQREGHDCVVKQFDHSCDALRYAIYTYFKPRCRDYGLAYFKEAG